MDPGDEPFGWKGYFERFAAPVLQRDRFFIGMLCALCVALAEAIALLTLVPLHGTVPYVIQTDVQGRVIASGQVTREVGRPTSDQVVYWLGRWASNLYRVDPAYSPGDLERAYAFTRGPATHQMMRFLKSRQSPIAILSANPAARATTKVQAVRGIGPNEAYVIVAVKDGLTGAIHDRGVTVTYSLSPPKTVREALMNPIGLRIDNFSVGGDI